MAAETKPTTEAAGLDSLAQQAQAAAAPPLGEGATDLDVAAQAGEAQQEQILTNREIIAGAIEGARDTFCAFTGLVTPQTTLNEQKVNQVADIWDRVCTRRGWQLQKFMGKNADIGFAIVATGKIVAALVVGVRMELAERKAKEPQPDAAPAAAADVPLEPATSGG